MIELKQLSKSFGAKDGYAVKDISLTIPKNETVVFLGSSGCGKTTTLKMINRIIEPSSGNIFVDGNDIMQLDPVLLRRSIGYIFQGIGLFPTMTVAENVGIIPKLLGWPRKKRLDKAYALLEMVHLPPDSYARKFPAELSGGQQQRVGVARALAADPDYLLMDEPFGALDALTRDSLQKELIVLKKNMDKTIIFVTHDIFEAFALADKIAVMHKGEIEQFDTKENLLHHPASDFVKELFAKTAGQISAFKDLLT